MKRTDQSTKIPLACLLQEFFDWKAGYCHIERISENEIRISFSDADSNIEHWYISDIQGDCSLPNQGRRFSTTNKFNIFDPHLMNSLRDYLQVFPSEPALDISKIIGVGMSFHINYKKKNTKLSITLKCL